MGGSFKGAPLSYNIVKQLDRLGHDQLSMAHSFQLVNDHLPVVSIMQYSLLVCNITEGQVSGGKGKTRRPKVQ
jgi:hypothetical protein